MAGLAFLVPLVGVVAACVTLGVSRAKHYRAKRPKPEPKPRPRPPRALTDDERARVLATLDSEEFMDLAPAQVYATLLEDGDYQCSERCSVPSGPSSESRPRPRRQGLLAPS
jgi:hypothetical protein